MSKKTTTDLVIMCKVATYGCWKDVVTLPVEYESKEKLIKDFMRLAIQHYKKLGYNYGRQSYFGFIGLCFEACDYYHEYDDGSVVKSPPTVFTLKEWFFDKYKTEGHVFASLLKPECLKCKHRNTKALSYYWCGECSPDHCPDKKH